MEKKHYTVSGFPQDLNSQNWGDLSRIEGKFSLFEEIEESKLRSFSQIFRKFEEIFLDKVMTNVKNLLGKVSNINIISNMDGYEQNKMSFFISR